jgi:hypothetical protein
MKAMVKPAGFDGALFAWLTAEQLRIEAYYAKNLTASVPTTLETEEGPKYIRIVETNDSGSQRGVFCFVERATGLVWKAASWKAPAKNFPRGNILAKRGNAPCPKGHDWHCYC